jgi:hypothetical protein
VVGGVGSCFGGSCAAADVERELDGWCALAPVPGQRRRPAGGVQAQCCEPRGCVRAAARLHDVSMQCQMCALSDGQMLDRMP